MYSDKERLQLYNAAINYIKTKQIIKPKISNFFIITITLKHIVHQKS